MVSAQNDIKIGAKAGATISSIGKAAEPLIETKAVAGFYFGGFVQIGLEEKISIQPELLFAGQGYKYDYGDDFYSESVRHILYYLNLPVALQYDVTDEFFLEGGPQFGYQVSNELKFDHSEDMSVPGGDWVYVKDEGALPVPLQGGGAVSPSTNVGLNRFDMGLLVGAGYRITPDLGVQARYVHGLLDAQKGDFIQVKNRTFFLGVFYVFGQ